MTTRESLILASEAIKTIETRQNSKVSCLEEIAFRQGYINAEQLEKLAQQYGQSDYGIYLKTVLETKV